MKILFIVNPVAGKGRALKAIPIIKELMNKESLSYKIVETTRPKEAIDIAYNGIQQGFEIITAVGGDGTVNEVAQGIMKSGKGCLGIIPAGTGNDLARSLDIPIDIKESIKCIIKGKHKGIDVGEVNGRYFFNVASIGFDSEIVKNTNNIKKYLKGKFAYTVGLLKTLISYKSKQMEIELDNKKIEMKTLLLAVANGKYYGGGMKISPMAVIDDDYFHTCVIKDISKLKLFFIFPSVFKGNHTRYKDYVSFYKSRIVKVKTLDRVYLNIDGELFKVDDEVVFRISERKINIISNCSV